MKAIKIDAKTRTIYEVVLEKKGDSALKSICTQLACDLITLVPVDETLKQGNDLFVDDEGLFKSDEQLPGAFVIDGFPQVLAGHGLIVGTDEEGESTDVTVTVEEVKNVITWRGKGDLLAI